MKKTEYSADVLVVGGGFAGICAAISAARTGADVILVHDRPMLGGNASSEIRMWPMGAHGKNRRETGIFEEIILENMRRNPTRAYPIWDSVLYEKVRNEKNIKLCLNCSVMGLEKSGDRITKVRAWQLTTYKLWEISAKIFIDCSGDSILAEESGALYRHGREARDEFGEEAAPEKADTQTMGNSLLLQARETEREVKYIPPSFIRKVSETDLKGRSHEMHELRDNNFWWLELGGDRNCIDDAEEVRDELLALSFGTWDHIKNTGEHNAEKWELDFAGFLPGKRESRRYVGDHLLNQNEVQAGGKFDDIIAYGGWKIDDHPPKGFDNFAVPTRYFDCPSPFGIPYGCIYSKNVENLMFAGRNISATHAAMAASRVMATCALLGQAAGTAAAMATALDISPRTLGEKYISKLQEKLMYDDVWLPGRRRKISKLCLDAVLENACEDLRSGIDRPTDKEGDNGYLAPLGEAISYKMGTRAYVKSLRIIFDSDLDRESVKGGIQEVRDCPTICNRPYNMPPYEFPTTMTSDFDILADGEKLYEIRGNRQRLVVLPVDREISSLSLIPLATCGDEKAHIFSFDFE